MTPVQSHFCFNFLVCVDDDWLFICAAMINNKRVSLVLKLGVCCCVHV